MTPTAMLITPNNSYVYVSLGSLGVQVLTLGSGGALSTGTAPTYSSARSVLRPARRTMGWRVIRVPHFYLWPRSIPGCAS